MSLNDGNIWLSRYRNWLIGMVCRCRCPKILQTGIGFRPPVPLQEVQVAADQKWFSAVGAVAGGPGGGRPEMVLADCGVAGGPVGVGRKWFSAVGGVAGGPSGGRPATL